MTLGQVSSSDFLEKSLRITTADKSLLTIFRRSEETFKTYESHSFDVIKTHEMAVVKIIDILQRRLLSFRV